ncbi:hypothetical protein C8Q80DRAFT_1175571 [Daedaleopsis nitida]|nr:hypothetical protein C8Q80DRAFT_1175522 [Daedaleopsis nitida]KAI0746521.1 hypothetical protein C8Q80DRAFT_1175571 [Daedaleopsis nitida]
MCPIGTSFALACWKLSSMLLPVFRTGRGFTSVITRRRGERTRRVDWGWEARVMAAAEESRLVDTRTDCRWTMCDLVQYLYGQHSRLPRLSPSLRVSHNKLARIEHTVHSVLAKNTLSINHKFLREFQFSYTRTIVSSDIIFVQD